MVSTVNDMPPGTEFTYLGRPCVALRYADEAEQSHSFEGMYGLVYEYVDGHGEIHKRCISPRDYDAFMAAVQIGPPGVAPTFTEEQIRKAFAVAYSR